MAVLAKEHNENKLFQEKKQIIIIIIIIIITGDRDEVGDLEFIKHLLTHVPDFFKIFNGVLTGIFMFILLTEIFFFIETPYDY